jgi:hypothetical protein
VAGKNRHRCHPVLLSCRQWPRLALGRAVKVAEMRKARPVFSGLRTSHYKPDQIRIQPLINRGLWKLEIHQYGMMFAANSFADETPLGECCQLHLSAGHCSGRSRGFAGSLSDTKTLVIHHVTRVADDQMLPVQQPIYASMQHR